MSRSLRSVDALAGAYLVGTGVMLLFGLGRGWVYPFCLGLHVAAVAGIIVLSRARSLPFLLQVVRETYPLLLLLGLYGEVDVLVQLVHEPPGFDTLVQQWDLWLFGGHPHRYLDQWLAGRGWTEFFHFLYLAYYVLLIGAYVHVWWARRDLLPRFAFVVTGMFASYIAVFAAFPVAGPLIAPENTITTTGVFPSLVAWVYAPLTMNGIYSGAFPSSHVGMSVGIGLLLAPHRWRWRVALAFLVLGIAVSTVYGRFHYAVDAVAGFLSGGLLYLLWMRLFTRLHPSPTPSPEPERTEEPTGPLPASPSR